MIIGQLPHCRRQITLAGGCVADDDVLDHFRGCVVCVSPVILEKKQLDTDQNRFYEVG